MQRTHALTVQSVLVLLVFVLAGCVGPPSSRNAADSVHMSEVEYELGDGGMIRIKSDGRNVDLRAVDGRLIYNGRDVGAYNGEPIRILADGTVLRDGKPLPATQ